MVSKRSIQSDHGVRIVHIVGGGVCTLILAAASALGVLPALRSHDADQEIRNRLSAVKQELDVAGEDHVILTERLENMRRDIESRDVVLTPMSGVNRLMAELTAIIESADLSLLTLQPGAPEPAGTLSVIPIQMWAEGTLSDTLDVLEQLRISHPDIHVHGLVLENAGPGTVRLRSEFGWLVVPSDEVE